MICTLCPRNCGAERNENTGKGFCRLPEPVRVARIAPHMWEEPCISGTKGSGAVFFSGCTMSCVFCQNYEISAENKGKTITAGQLAEEFRRLEAMGVHNLNLVSATPYVPQILRAFEIYKPKIPVVYNCGGYEKTETVKMLEGAVDIWLPDFKYSDNNLAEKYSYAPRYVETAAHAIKEMLRQSGEAEFDEDGIIKKGTIIRHLVLPNYTKNSLGVLEIIKNELPGALVSLMGQYIPLGRAGEFDKLNRKITSREYKKVSDRLFDLGLDGYVQDLSSASEEYVPSWDY